MIIKGLNITEPWKRFDKNNTPSAVSAIVCNLPSLLWNRGICCVLVGNVTLQIANSEHVVLNKLHVKQTFRYTKHFWSALSAGRQHRDTSTLPSVHVALVCCGVSLVTSMALLLSAQTSY